MASRDNTLGVLENETMKFFRATWQLQKDGTWDGTRKGDGMSRCSVLSYCGLRLNQMWSLYYNTNRKRIESY